MNIKDIKPGDKKWTHLSPELRDRALAMYPVVCQVYPVTKSKWIEGFLHDLNPDREIAIWEKLVAKLKTIPLVKDRKKAFQSWLENQTFEEVPTGN